ncbi:nuclear transcription factor Y subunit beta-like isoform X2 [Parasteatoda tepidariorum]|uniref:nuclear transcription factor Y subunit beta-like isoform X2 n=1 Tax=Parasteatoda tepidariorum TaxID=114398 RepID=UPI00077FB2CF|nr:uncharacterized transmembrane protein DDB_G0281039-like [Parasteatoda tepidariorum]
MKFQITLSILSTLVLTVCSVGYGPTPQHAAPQQYQQVQYQRQPVQYQPVQYERQPVQHQQYPAHQQQPQQQYLVHQQQPQQQYPVHQQHAPQQYSPVPVTYVQSEPAAHQSSSEAYKHGAHGQQAAGHTQYNQGYQADKLSHANNAASANGQHHLGAHNSRGTHGTQHNQQGTYSNVGSYSQDTGSGFEKSYSFDRANGYHDIDATNSGQSSSQATQAKQNHHNIGSHGSQSVESQGAHSSAAKSSHGVQTHSKSLFDKYGYSHGGKQQGYSYSPLYGYGYH